MSALTLAMMQLADLNPDDYFNVRAYCIGMDLRGPHNHQGRPGAESPTSESSGVSSYGSGSSDRDSGSVDLARAAGRRASTASTTSSLGAPPPAQDERQQQHEDQNNEVASSSEKEDIPSPATPDSPCSECINKDVQVVYQGRDILNLGGHIRQSLLWHMKSSHISPFTLALYTRRQRDRIIENLRTRICGDCGFMDYENSHVPEIMPSRQVLMGI